MLFAQFGIETEALDARTVRGAKAGFRSIPAVRDAREILASENYYAGL
jgi:hypothetical protein